MLFIHPMWDHESQRVGKQKCTPAGYALHVLAEWVGLVGLLLLLIWPAVLARRAVIGTIEWGHLWPLAVPLGVGAVSEVLFRLSWRLASRRGFRYDYAQSEASWLEAGERRTYKYPA